MYCTECYIRDGKGTEDAGYIFNGKSLCNIHLWEEIRTKHLPAKPETLGPATTLRTTRGTRLSEGWEPAVAKIHQMMAELNCGSSVLEMQHRKFMDHFLSVPGQRGVKMDWNRTWCNWMRTASERGDLHGTLQGTVADKAKGWIEMSGHARAD